MKKLSLIIHKDLEESLSDYLHSLPQVKGFTFIHVEGHGTEATSDLALSARDLVMGFRPQIRTDLLLEDHQVGQVLESLRGAKLGLSGHTFFWVTPVEQSGRL